MKNTLIKTTIVSMLFCFIVTGVKAQLNLASASEIINKAYKAATRNKKKVLVVFQASWNPWCGVLESAMVQPEAKAIFDKYYVVTKITVEEKGEQTKFENPGATELFAKYYANSNTMPPIKKKVPCLIFLSTDGNKIGQYTGFPEGKEALNDFETVLKATSNINQNEIGVLRKAFINSYLKVAVPSASEILNSAYAQAKAENKNVLLIFHASWCHWCHVLDTAMNDAACKSLFNDKYVICHLTVHEADKYLTNENLGAEKLIADFQAGLNTWNKGIPFSVFFDKNGNKLGDFNGFPVPFYAGYKDFDTLLKNTTSFTEADLKIITKAFERTASKFGLNPKK